MFDNLLNDENLGDPQNKFYLGDPANEFYLGDPQNSGKSGKEFCLDDSQCETYLWRFGKRVCLDGSQCETYLGDPQIWGKSGK